MSIQSISKMRVSSLTLAKALSDKPELHEKRPWVSRVRAAKSKPRVNIPQFHWLKEQPKSATSTSSPQLVVRNSSGSGQSEFYHILRTITWSSNCCRHGGTCHWALCCHNWERTRARTRGCSNRKSWIMLAFDLLHLPRHHVNKLRHSVTKVAKQSKIIIHSCLYDDYQRERSDSIAFECTEISTLFFNVVFCEYVRLPVH